MTWSRFINNRNASAWERRGRGDSCQRSQAAGRWPSTPTALRVQQPGLALDTRRDSGMHGLPGTGGRGRVGYGRGTPISGAQGCQTPALRQTAVRLWVIVDELQKAASDGTRQGN
ncbi:uncharacterized protein FTOL_03340 [Fusarium torulosum]|uniref:Uncharacterized protein n=1 Tax=Fusarium torulosum TaxID=33205 RepID=A0AAE8M3I0_9HYPO|nr:uncharacterized protein FTOL_03340 [Fusarium torulosum]